MTIDTYEVDGQISLLDPEEYKGKPCKRFKRELTRKDMMKLVAVPIQVLDLTPGHGDLLGDAHWEIHSPLLEDGTLLNTGVAPRKPIVSSLSSILEPHPARKYYLSRTACLGILRRAEERGKELPEQLKAALMAQAELAPIAAPDGLKANQSNQRIRSDEASGAPMATINGDPAQAQQNRPRGERRSSRICELLPLGGSEGYGVCDGAQMQTFAAQLESPLAFAANQRAEVQGLHDVAGALQTQHGMKQQTFVAAAFSAGQGAKAGGIGYQEECAPTLKAVESGTNMVPSVLCLNDQGGSAMECTEGITGILRAQRDGHHPLVYENHSTDTRYTGPYLTVPTVPTLTARAGAGGDNLPLVADMTASPLCITGNLVDRQLQNDGNGLGCQEEIATLTSTDRYAVFNCQRVDIFKDDVVSTQSIQQHKDATDLVMDVAGLDCRNARENGNLCGTLQKGTSGSSLNSVHPIRNGQLIRRLTPLECERLQGFPDGWTDISSASDSARYKALGNSVAIPCVEYVMRGIALALAAQDMSG